MTLRRQNPGATICITDQLAHTYIPMSPEPADLALVDVHIKRADGTTLGEEGNVNATDWLLRYPAADYDAGYIGFRWDDELHALPVGRYIAEIQVDCVPCGRFELVQPLCAHHVGKTSRSKDIGDLP